MEEREREKERKGERKKERERKRERERGRERKREEGGVGGGERDLCLLRAMCRYKNFSKVSSTTELTTYKSYRADMKEILFFRLFEHDSQTKKAIMQQRDVFFFLERLQRG